MAHLLPEELPAIQKRPTIASAGGGHHLYSLRRTGELVSRGHDVVLVNSSRDLLYSGRATGVISHTYAPKEDRTDVSLLVERGGGRFVEGRVAGSCRPIVRWLWRAGSAAATSWLPSASGMG